MTYAILMLTHNRLDAVQRCFSSLRPTLRREDVSIWVVDNGSDTETVAHLIGLYDDDLIGLTRLGENLGVSGGRRYMLDDYLKPRNHLPEYLRISKPDIFVFLDSDVVITDDRWLDTLGKALEPENVGLVGPGGSMVLPDWSNFGPAMPGTECDCVAGFCQAFKREVLQVASIDTEYGMFWTEDSDFCLQIREAGYDVRCVPCGVMHYPGHSGDEPGLHERNLQRFREKWAGKGLVKVEGGY